MAELRELNINLLDWEIRYILEAISKEMQSLRQVAETSEDEDEAADSGNDFIEISGLYKELSEKAVSAFGEQILNFSRESL